MKDKEPKHKPNIQPKILKNEVRFIQRRFNMRRIGRTGK